MAEFREVVQPGIEVISLPQWPSNVVVATTTRVGGRSSNPYSSFNMGLHVGDHSAKVQQNRERLALALPQSPDLTWMDQVHGTAVVEARGDSGQPPQADASWTRESCRACAVMTADCLPVLLTDREGSVVAAAHAGWRGLASGVLEHTVASMRVGAAQLLAWLGPSIGPEEFEVGPEVRETFLRRPGTPDTPRVEACFAQSPKPGCFLADLPMLAALRLEALGATAIHVDGRCTVAGADTFFSYRRDGETGRMASLIYRRRT